MRIYVSGVGGVAMGPIALIAQDMGHEVYGSNDIETDLTKVVEQRGVEVIIGQDGSDIMRLHQAMPIDWFIHTAALREDHPEFVFAQEHGIRISKRDAFINYVLEERDLKLIAVAGTHGKTNTTSMVIWCLQQAGIPVSYSVGAQISFGPYGVLDETSEYFVYEADEFDKNMLQFEPAISLITNVEFDHPDTYSSIKEYQDSFEKFITSSDVAYLYEDAAYKTSTFDQPGVQVIEKDMLEASTSLPGLYIRQNARLVLEMLHQQFGIDKSELTEYINDFPGSSRRMEKIADGLYSDYAHHPDELESVLLQAKDLSKKVLCVYQPHQNIRQHEIKSQYKLAFNNADEVLWLPTYLSRETDSELAVLSPEDLISYMNEPSKATPANMDKQLIDKISTALENGFLVVCCSAGNLDPWIREHFA